MFSWSMEEATEPGWENWECSLAEGKAPGTQGAPGEAAWRDREGIFTARWDFGMEFLPGRVPRAAAAAPGSPECPVRFGAPRAGARCPCQARGWDELILRFSCTLPCPAESPGAAPAAQPSGMFPHPSPARPELTVPLGLHLFSLPGSWGQPLLEQAWLHDSH